MSFRKIFRRAVSMFFVVSIMLFAAVTHAEIYTGEGSYIMSEGENLGVAKERAKADAMHNAAEKAGTYVKSYARSKNFELEEMIIETMTSNILKLIGNPTFLPYEQLDNLEGLLIRVTVNVNIENDDVLKWLNKSENEREELVKQNEALIKANIEQEKQIAELKRQLAKSTTAEDKERITQAFANEDKIFLSNQKVSEAWKVYYTGDYNGSIKIFTEAIELNPQNGLAYYGRAYAYNDLKNYRQAIEDCSKAVQFDNPRLIDAYNNRGEAYRKSGNYKQAIADYNKAIEMNPQYVKAYNNRGIAYKNLGNYEQAFADYAKAIKLDQNYPFAYYNRAYAYLQQKNYKQAIADFSKYIQLVPNDTDAYIERGLCYKELGEEAKARADFDKAKQLYHKG